jgi:hypothetical protein
MTQDFTTPPGEGTSPARAMMSAVTRRLVALGLRLSVFGRLREAEIQLQSLACEIDAIRGTMREACEAAGFDTRPSLYTIQGGQR